MPGTTMTSREFNQDASGAKRAAEKGPVFITDRGRPAHVLMTIDEYQRLTGRTAKIADLLAMKEGADIDLETVLPKRDDKPRAADLD